MERIIVTTAICLFAVAAQAQDTTTLYEVEVHAIQDSEKTIPEGFDNGISHIRFPDSNTIILKGTEKDYSIVYSKTLSPGGQKLADKFTASNTDDLLYAVASSDYDIEGNDLALIVLAKQTTENGSVVLALTLLYGDPEKETDPIWKIEVFVTDILENNQN